MSRFAVIFLSLFCLLPPPAWAGGRESMADGVPYASPAVPAAITQISCDLQIRRKLAHQASAPSPAGGIRAHGMREPGPSPSLGRSPSSAGPSWMFGYFSRAVLKSCIFVHSRLPATASTPATTTTTTVDADGHTAIRVNLPPIGFNKALVSRSATSTKNSIKL